MEVINDLLVKTTAARKKYDEIIRLSGINFNVFKILKLEANEVRTHSAFIGEILNPKGSHGQNDKFLRLFADQFGFHDFDTSSGRVQIEKHVGLIGKDYSEGGSIDIIISNDDKCIIIENKIYAGDQLKQLKRYHHCGKTTYPAFHKILYLTLNGKQPEESSYGDLVCGEDFLCISYASDIIKWLKECVDAATDHSILKETLVQYLHLIETLTKQTNTDYMKDEIKRVLLSSPDNFKSAQLLGNLYHEIKGDIYNKFSEDIEEREGEIRKELPWNEYKIIFDINEDNEGFFFAFQVVDQNGKKSNQTQFDKLVSILKRVHNSFQSNHNYIGYIFPKNIKRFYEMNIDVIYSLDDDVKRKAFIDNLFNEGLEYYKLFESSLQLMHKSEPV